MADPPEFGGETEDDSSNPSQLQESSNNIDPPARLPQRMPELDHLYRARELLEGLSNRAVFRTERALAESTAAATEASAGTTAEGVSEEALELSRARQRLSRTLSGSRRQLEALSSPHSSSSSVSRNNNNDGGSGISEASRRQQHQHVEQVLRSLSRLESTAAAVAEAASPSSARRARQTEAYRARQEQRRSQRRLMQPENPAPVDSRESSPEGAPSNSNSQRRARQTEAYRVRQERRRSRRQLLESSNHGSNHSSNPLSVDGRASSPEADASSPEALMGRIEANLNRQRRQIEAIGSALSGLESSPERQAAIAAAAAAREAAEDEVSRSRRQRRLEAIETELSRSRSGSRSRRRRRRRDSSGQVHERDPVALESLFQPRHSRRRSRRMSRRQDAAASNSEAEESVTESIARGQRRASNVVESLRDLMLVPTASTLSEAATERSTTPRSQTEGNSGSTGGNQHGASGSGDTEASQQQDSEQQDSAARDSSSSNNNNNNNLPSDHHNESHLADFLARSRERYLRVREAYSRSEIATTDTSGNRTSESTTNGGTEASQPDPNDGANRGNDNNDDPFRSVLSLLARSREQIRRNLEENENQAEEESDDDDDDDDDNESIGIGDQLDLDDRMDLGLFDRDGILQTIMQRSVDMLRETHQAGESTTNTDLKCPVCSEVFVDYETGSHPNAPANRSSTKCSHGAMLLFTKLDHCPICFEEHIEPPNVIALACGHVVCKDDFCKLGGHCGADRPEGCPKAKPVPRARNSNNEDSPRESTLGARDFSAEARIRAMYRLGQEGS